MFKSILPLNSFNLAIIITIAGLAFVQNSCCCNSSGTLEEQTGNIKEKFCQTGADLYFYEMDSVLKNNPGIPASEAIEKNTGALESISSSELTTFSVEAPDQKTILLKCINDDELLLERQYTLD